MLAKYTRIAADTQSKKYFTTARGVSKRFSFKLKFCRKCSIFNFNNLVGLTFGAVRKMIPKLKPECIPLSLPCFGLQVLVQGGKRGRGGR